MRLNSIALHFLVMSTIVESSAQSVRSWDADGKIQKSTADFLSGSGSDTPRRAVPVAMIPIVLGAGINIYNTLKEKKEATYTGVYSNTFSFKHLPKTIKVQRELINDKVGDAYAYEKLSVAATYDLEVTKTPEQITISVYSAELVRSKACYKPGQKLAVSMDITLTGTAADGSSLDLGEANIIIPIIYVRKDPFDFTAKELEPFVSKANFLPLPAPSDQLPVSMSVKITEVNLDKVEPSVVEAILKSNGSDIIDVLKGALGVD